MIRMNEHYLKLQKSYLFSDIARRVAAFETANSDACLIRLGIGDVTQPLPPACIEAFRRGVDDMASAATFKGYGPEQGYAFLREAIAGNDYRSKGVNVAPEEIFVSDGAKCDTGNFQELFAADTVIAVPNPVYPVYVDTNVMAGRTGAAWEGRYVRLVYLDATEQNGYVAPPPADPVDVVYLCYPNNPTGATATHDQLRAWVEYAHRHRALILFDAAYEAFIRDESLPRSIFEIEGAREVAVEFRSFSKTAGFTGTRCAFTVVPTECRIFDASGNAYPLAPLWNRRQTTKFNGVSYPVQRAAEAVYSDEGRRQVRSLIDGYMANASLIREGWTRLGYTVTGGENAPYLWIRTGTDSWAFFDKLLNEARVVVTPGSGFGSCGQGYIRISAFNSEENVKEAMRRIEEVLGQ